MRRFPAVLLPAALLPAALLAACAELPEVGSDTPGPYPKLVPLAPLLARADAPAAPDPAAELDARVAALEARAAALRNVDTSSPDAPER